ncbi:MAG: hypothetical protein J0I79_16415 [Mesorhizobium sp.]|uniref:hypothetical protein n=1 Tax=Mesorhizobium sp. TaxID=1871066 RepID=UPI001AD2AC22|nr:hypothetical protein [Mesorhizobium sp.]MBN9219530.1 hypothetical protein [Mesorhizobium sp.]
MSVIWFALAIGIVFGMAVLSAFAWLILYLAWIGAWLVAIAALLGVFWVGFKAWHHTQP